MWYFLPESIQKAQRKIDTNYEQAAISVPLVQKMEDERKDYYTKQRHYETLFYFIIYSP